MNVVTSTILRRRPGRKRVSSASATHQPTLSQGTRERETWCPSATMTPTHSSQDSPVKGPGLGPGRKWANGSGVMAHYGAMNHGPQVNVLCNFLIFLNSTAVLYCQTWSLTILKYEQGVEKIDRTQHSLVNILTIDYGALSIFIFCS